MSDIHTGNSRMCYIKSFKAIENLAHAISSKPIRKKTLILHSSGEGGGLYVSKEFMDMYFGTQRLINIKFLRYGNGCREIWQDLFDQSLYGEWLTDIRDFMLEDDLFEL
jgi:hypothetical protein